MAIDAECHVPRQRRRRCADSFLERRLTANHHHPADRPGHCGVEQRPVQQLRPHHRDDHGVELRPLRLVGRWAVVSQG